MTVQFPAEPLPIKVEIDLNGTWTDISAYVYQRNNIVISAIGRPDESSSIQPGQMTLTLNNRDGRFTPLNSAGAYYPNLGRNVQIRLSVNGQSMNGTTYSGYRFWGEVTEWPPEWDASGNDVYASITASGPWRRLSQDQQNIGSAFFRYYENLTGTSIPASYWSMEDGSGSAAFVVYTYGGDNASWTGGPPSLAATTGFPGSDAIPTLNGAVISGTVVSAATPTDNVLRFLLDVPSGGDTGAAGANEVLAQVLTSGTIAKFTVTLAGSGDLTITGYNSGGTQLFTGTLSTSIEGTPVLVSAELTPSGSSVAWKLQVIEPGAGSVLASVNGTQASATLSTVNTWELNPSGVLTGTAVGHLAVLYAVPSITTAADALGGWNGEYAADRFTRICTEEGIGYELIGTDTTSAQLGPQADDTLTNVLQTCENTDCGLLYESIDQFGLGYRILASMQSQSAAATFNYATATLAGSLQPSYDDQLIRNNVTVTNYDGYVQQAVLVSGAMSVLAPPNGVGNGYAYPRTVNAYQDSQIAGIATHILNVGTVNQERYPEGISLDLSRTEVESLFGTIPAVRIGDFIEITNPPSWMPSTTIKQLAWGRTETLNAFAWTFTFNAVPEAPYESGYSPGTAQVAQAPSAPVTAGQASAGAVTGALIADGAITAAMLSTSISARTLGGITTTIAGTAPGSPMDGDIWIDSANGYQINQYSGGAWNAVTFTATDTIAAGTITASLIAAATITGSLIAAGTITAGNIQAGTITATLIAANAITAGLIAAGAVDGMTINGVTINGDTINAADVLISGTNGGLFAYGNITPQIRGTVVNNYTEALGSVSSVTYNVTHATLTGDAVLVSAGWVQVTATTVSSVTDSKSNTYSLIQSESSNVYQFIALNATALATSDTITIHFSAASANNDLFVIALDCLGVASASATDKTAVGTGTPAQSLATGTLSQVPELAVSTWHSGNSGGGATTPTLDDSVFTNSSVVSTFGGNFATFAAYLNSTSTVTNTVTCAGGAGSTLTGCLVTLKGSSSTQALIAAIAGAAGTDPVLGDSAGPGLNLYNQASAPAAVSGAVVAYAGTGQMKYVGADGIAYNTGRVAVYTTGTQTFGSTTQAGVTGLSITLTAGKYRFRAVLYFVEVAANTAFLTMGGTCSTSAFNAMITYNTSTAFCRQQTVLGTNTGLNSDTLASSGTYTCYIDGNITVSTGGTLTVNGAASTNANTFTTQKGCILEIFPDN